MRGFFRRLLSIFPTKLPITYDQFTRFSSKIFLAYDVPNLPSFKQVIAQVIMHLPPTKFYVSKRHFGLTVKKAQANQVAWEILEEIRRRDKEEAEKAKLEQQARELKSGNDHISKQEVQTTASEVVQQIS